MATTRITATERGPGRESDGSFEWGPGQAAPGLRPLTANVRVSVGVTGFQVLQARELHQPAASVTALALRFML